MSDSVLIVDSDTEHQAILMQLFLDYGFEAVGVSTYEEARKLLKSFVPSILILDLKSPKMKALDFCRELRMESNNWTPMILLSSKDDELEAVLGLELGADDYLLKPVRGKELLARVKSIIRRSKICCNDQGEQTPNPTNKKLVNGDLLLDPDHFMLYKNNKPVDLTRKEYELLYYLFVNRGKALLRSQLLKELAGEEVDLDERIIDVFISRIRNKIEPSRRNPVYVKTVRNIGYMMKDFSSEKVKSI
ncbi:response regulator transcription factor [Evansella sp. AB-rgal1]|uniref:response regulator transcription factor n=1 Tax=Evansella sp. AB-rgal1 TaxID=3242696 RepID=UPI00359DDC60